jgi:hypothetical protein
MSTRSMTGVCFCVLTIALAVSPAFATCSNASLKGVFGYFHGRPGANPAAVVVGQLTLDGLGNITAASWTQSSVGTISTGTTTGTYSISTNCNGKLTLKDEGGVLSHFNIYLNTGNTMFQMIGSDTGDNQPGFGLAQGTVTCGFSGKTVVLTTNLVGLDNGVVADTVGRVTLNGKGSISGSETFTMNGVVTTLAVTGTYTENSNCTGTWRITPKGGTATNFNTVVVNSGKELLLIQTDNNTITGGNAQQ